MRSLNFLSLLMLFSCAEDHSPEQILFEECAEVNLVDSLSSAYLRVSHVLDSTWVTSYDTISGTWIDYRICDKEPLLDIESTKIINAGGYIYNSCEGEELFLRLENVSVMETCLPEIETLQEESDLSGKWYFYELETKEGSFMPPCESGELGIEIIEIDNKTYLHAQTHALGGAGGEIQIEGQTIRTLYVEQSLIFPETQAESAFSKAYCDVIVCESVNVELEYAIEKNFLIITNQIEPNSKLKLFKK